MEDFTKVVLGDMPIGIFLGCFFIALIAAAGLVLYRAVGKADEAKGTPEGFHWGFFFLDNMPKWILQVITIGIMIRVGSVGLTDSGMFPAAFAIGLGSGQFSIWTQGVSNKARQETAKNE